MGFKIRLNNSRPWKADLARISLDPDGLLPARGEQVQRLRHPWRRRWPEVRSAISGSGRRSGFPPSRTFSADRLQPASEGQRHRRVLRRLEIGFPEKLICLIVVGRAGTGLGSGSEAQQSLKLGSIIIWSSNELVVKILEFHSGDDVLCCLMHINVTKTCSLAYNAMTKMQKWEKKL